MKRPLARGILPLLLAAAVPAAAQDPVASAPDRPVPAGIGKPVEIPMRRAGSTTLDLRLLPQTKPRKVERPEREEPEIERVALPGRPPAPSAPVPPSRNAPAPPPIQNFDGLDFTTWGAGHPPDTNGDVGPTYFIETVNTSIGIYAKATGAQVAAFTYDTFMSQGHFGNLCDTDNFGDPVVLYDSFEDRWVITDFAFQLDGSGNVVNPPGSFQCFAVSKTGDPVAGGWNFYSINTAGGLGDYPKFGIWPDGLYMSANMFDYASSGSFQNPRVYALNKAQMYAGSPTVQVVTFDAPSSDFTLLPSNARLQAGTPPSGSPNYFVATWDFLNALTVYKFHVDWNRVSLSTFTGPDTPLAATSWPNASVPNAPSQGGNALDVLQIRAMMQNQYTNIGGAESLWAAHTVRRGNTSGFAAPRWYQVDVTGGTVNPNLPQASTWDPDGANVIYRFLPSLALDRAGDMVLGYSTSSSTTKPAIKYAGRLSTDPANTLAQTEQLLIQGTGTQTGTCGGATCARWGDYSAMTLDPDGCTFWYSNEYYATDGLNDLTRIGSFAFPSCTPLGGGGTLSGTVTATVGGAPVAGATLTFGSRSATTDGSGLYSFTPVPAGTYPGVSASAPGYASAAAAGIVVSDGNTTTQNFSLAASPVSGCLTDTTQSDFQTGVTSNTDLTSSPGDVVLVNAPTVDQQNGTVGTSGVGITTTTWGGQTFTPSVTGLLTKADIHLFCSGCTGTTPNLTLSLRATSSGLPTGADLASATITGFSSGADVVYTGTFASPPTLTSGTQYALVIRPTANPSPGTYALTRSGTATAGADVYAGGTRVSGATSGTVWSIPLTGGVSTDAGFRTYMDTGYAASGTFVSSLKDANPPAGFSASWTTLSFTAATPAGTALSFQVAASNSASGPFVFVGPDGTAGTTFTTSGASLAQFNGNRYLEYEAFLTTSDSTMTPTLSDVTVCYSDACVPPATPTITPGGPTTFCAGGSVTLTSSSASGNQWLLNGNPIGGATNQTYAATASGSYTVTVTTLGCTSAPSLGTTVTVEPLPSAPVISAPASVAPGSTGNTASVTPHAGSTYAWTIAGGTITSSPTGTSITFTAGGVGTLTLSVVETDANGCVSNTGSVDVAVTGYDLYALAPCRILDTRNPDGAYGGPAIAALSSRTFVAAGQCGIPSGAKAVSVNVTVTGATASGDIIVHQAGIIPNPVPTIDYSAGQTRANNAFVALGASGDFTVKSDQPTGTVHVIVDVNGYFQ